MSFVCFRSRACLPRGGGFYWRGSHRRTPLRDFADFTIPRLCLSAVRLRPHFRPPPPGARLVHVSVQQGRICMRPANKGVYPPILVHGRYTVVGGSSCKVRPCCRRTSQCAACGCFPRLCHFLHLPPAPHPFRFHSYLFSCVLRDASVQQRPISTRTHVTRMAHSLERGMNLEADGRFLLRRHCMLAH